LLLIGILIAVSFEDVLLSALLSAFALLALMLLAWVQRFAPPHWRADRECEASFWGFAGEMLMATEDIQSCGATQYALRLFTQRLRSWRPIALRANLWGMIWMAADAVYIVGTTLSWWMGGALVLDGTLSLGTLYMIGHYLGLLIWGSIGDIQYRLQDLQHARVSIVRVQELLSTKSALVDGAALLPPEGLSIAFKDVSFAYPDGNEQMDEPAKDPTTQPPSQRAIQRSRSA
jgi:ATP-binding cassette subfamily B protein